MWVIYNHSMVVAKDHYIFMEPLSNEIFLCCLGCPLDKRHDETINRHYLCEWCPWKLEWPSKKVGLILGRPILAPSTPFKVWKFRTVPWELGQPNLATQACFGVPRHARAAKFGCRNAPTSAWKFSGNSMWRLGTPSECLTPLIRTLSSSITFNVIILSFSTLSCLISYSLSLLYSNNIHMNETNTYMQTCLNLPN